MKSHRSNSSRSPRSNTKLAPVVVQDKLCLNAAYKSANCQQCVTTCPSNAIVVYEGYVQLNSSLCSNCGVCLHQCPSGVFSQANTVEATLVDTLATLPDTAIALVCQRNTKPSQARAPVTRVIQHHRCLAAISLTTLLELSNGGSRKIWLDDSHCISCPISKARATLVKMVIAVNQLLENLGHKPVISTYRLQPQDLTPGPATKALIYSNQPRISRRQFFSALTHRGRQFSIKTSNQDDKNKLELTVNKRLPKHLSESRTRLLVQLKKLNGFTDQQIEADSIPFAQLKIDADCCSACELCVKFCPGAALQFHRSEEGFSLAFRASQCIDCGICAKACPEQAISFTSQITVTALTATEPQQLVQGGLVSCDGCGRFMATLATNPQKPLCFTCRETGGNAKPLQDTMGLFADLSGRITVKEAGKQESEGT